MTKYVETIQLLLCENKVSNAKLHEIGGKSGKLLKKMEQFGKLRKNMPDIGI